MAFGTAARQALALLIFNATAWANWADNAASTPVTNIYSTLHTADPTSGNQTTSEASYTGATRVAVPAPPAAGRALLASHERGGRRSRRVLERQQHHQPRLARQSGEQHR
jgi:hypothetical protein